jgi:hypothetical protein
MDETIEPTTVKETGECHEPLVWSRVDEGDVSVVDGVKVSQTIKRLIAKCATCNTIYKKAFVEEETPTEPTVVDLDKV